MNGDLVTPGGIVVPAHAMTWRFSRGTGPGGQGVNTTDSRVELVVDLTAIVAPDVVAGGGGGGAGGAVPVVAAPPAAPPRDPGGGVPRPRRGARQRGAR